MALFQHYNDHSRKAAAVATPRHETHDRLTAIVTLHHERFGEPPFSVDARYSELLGGQEQPFQRKLNLASEAGWQPLDCGWIERPGMIVIENRAGTNRQVIPSPEEIAATAHEVLLVSVDGTTPALVVRPGRCLVIEHQEARRLQMSAAAGTIPVVITVLPQ